LLQLSVRGDAGERAGGLPRGARPAGVVEGDDRRVVRRAVARDPGREPRRLDVRDRVGGARDDRRGARLGRVADRADGAGAVARPRTAGAKASGINTIPTKLTVA